MGRNLGHSVVIDFCGLPGTGKSTVSHIVAQRLRELGHSVLEPSYGLDHECSSTGRIARKMINATTYALFDIHFFKVGLKLRETQSLFSTIKLVTNHYYIKNSIRKKQAERFLIFDQGLVQSMWSILYGNQGMSTFLLDYCSNRLNWDGRKAFVIYLYAPYNTVTSRIQERGNDASRLGKDIENGQVDLSDYDRIFDQILSSIQKSDPTSDLVKVLRIENGNDSPVTCANNVLDHLNI